MIYEILDRNLIFPGLDAPKMEDVMTQVGGALTKAGYAKDTYVEALIAREKEYPTALDVDGYGVAIPHTPVDHINKTVIGVAVLKEPTDFIAMGTDDETIGVRIIFMLCIAGTPGAHDHLDELQRILAIIQDTAVLDKLLAAKSADEIMNIIKEKENTL